jgi:hypothetical protein
MNRKVATIRPRETANTASRAILLASHVHALNNDVVEVLLFASCDVALDMLPVTEEKECMNKKTKNKHGIGHCSIGMCGYGRAKAKKKKKKTEEIYSIHVLEVWSAGSEKCMIQNIIRRH